MPATEWPVVGQHHAVDFLENLLEFERAHPGRLGGSYIFSGPRLVGKTDALECFLKRLCGSEEYSDAALMSDVVRLRRQEGKHEIGISLTREFISRLGLSSFAGKYRIGIIEGADGLSTEAANALLKTLEDGRGQLMVFLLAASIERLPATVISRSQIVSFRPVPTDEIYDWLISQHKVSRPLAKNLARLAGGRPNLALTLATDKEALERWLAPARLLLAAPLQRLSERWSAVSSLLGSAKGPEAADTATEIFSSWRLVVRDIMLAHLNQPDLVRHAFLEQDIKDAARRISLSEARSLDAIFGRGIEYVDSNVSPKMALEQALLAL